MSVQPSPYHSAPRRFTSTVLTGGAMAAAACFAIALLAEIAGIDPGSGEMTDPAAVLDGLLTLTPWAWATLGSYAVVLTPVIGLLVTAYEYASAGDRRTVMLAIGVIVILGTSAVVAILR